MRIRRPRRLEEVEGDGDLIITVCDVAHEELGARSKLHWSVPDPVPVGTPFAFNRAFDELDRRVTELAPCLAVAAVAAAN
jgi:ArsR family transcriptional regulator, arsenate/arsenite/antimonite-responsive transcriptional repressor / arsenate reductase (thioredoxin)